MRLARILIALPLLALSIALAGGDRWGDKIADQIAPSSLCSDCGERTQRLHTDWQCNNCGAKSDLCDSCFAAKKVCPACREKLGSTVKDRRDRPDKGGDPFVREGICAGQCVPTCGGITRMCGACGERLPIQRGGLCQTCADKKGVCPVCLKRLPDKPAPAAETCPGECKAGEIVAAIALRCPACRKGDMPANAKLCKACAAAKGVCRYCERPPAPKEDPFVRKGGCICFLEDPKKETWAKDGPPRPCPACGKKSCVFDENRICPDCEQKRGVCPRCLGKK